MAAPSDTKINVHTAFATPVATAQLAGAEHLNKRLTQLIRSRTDSHSSTRHSNLGGWQSSWDFLDWGGTAGRELLDHVTSLADRLTADREGRPVKVKWKINAWANVNELGHGNEFHTHPGAFWSGTYYVDDGGIVADPSLGGEFEFQDPRGVLPAMYAPLLCIAMPGGASMGASETMHPRAGMMVLFPAWLSHGVRPYHGTGQRISVAFNLSV